VAQSKLFISSACAGNKPKCKNLCAWLERNQNRSAAYSTVGDACVKRWVDVQK